VRRIASGEPAAVSVEGLEKEILAEAETAAGFSLQPVINATGVILHTNRDARRWRGKLLTTLAETPRAIQPGI